jgi:predicted ATPase
MITRLKINGFKNLVGVDLHFGPFTCVAGANGVGKSNLFDAIRFLSSLASKSLTEAALTVRDDDGKGDVRAIFHRIGGDFAPKMDLEVEMIVPRFATDDFGQKAEATNTFLRYHLILGWRQEPPTGGYAIEIHEETLSHITLQEASAHLPFPHKANPWRRSIIQAKRRAPYFISTPHTSGERKIFLHQDRQEQHGGGRPLPRPARTLPRTILSAANAAEAPTVLCAKREMESWTLLQLEPSAMRRPDNFNSPSHVGHNGAYLAATLYRLASHADDPQRIYTRVANRLSELIEDVRGVCVERDERRETLTLVLTDKDGTKHSARALSDGTLRFMALGIRELDSEATGLLCLEEPENGIHPDRIAAMLRLLKETATDPEEFVNETNPLRQIMVNTHSPLVVAECDDHSLLLARSVNAVDQRRLFRRVQFACLPDTWRAKADKNFPVASRGELLAYLQPASFNPRPRGKRAEYGHRRVADRPDLQAHFEHLLVAEE